VIIATPSASETEIPVTPANEPADAEEPEGETNIGLLVVSIVMMVLFAGLFAFLMYTEKRRRDERPAKAAAENQNSRNPGGVIA
jgi:heme/copper-type cytochrome/quinol oxidase subunit 2